MCLNAALAKAFPTRLVLAKTLPIWETLPIAKKFRKFDFIVEIGGTEKDGKVKASNLDQKPLKWHCL